MSYITDKFDSKVVKSLKEGGVGLLPTDTIYGISCAALNQQAVERAHILKDRDGSKPFIILISSLEMLDLLSIDKDQIDTVKSYWPGSVTLICDAPHSPHYLHLGTQTLAIRWPRNSDLQSLIEQTGPLISTSANLQGASPINSATEATEQFGESLDFYVDYGSLANHQPSTLVRAVDGKLEVIRQGEVKIKEAI